MNIDKYWKPKVNDRTNYPTLCSYIIYAHEYKAPAARSSTHERQALVERARRSRS